MRRKELEDRIFSISGKSDFEQVALEVFQFQYENNALYRKYVDILDRSVIEVSDIPFLPIEFFKSPEIIHQCENPELLFTSSGTTGSVVSKHPVQFEEVYIRSFKKCFNLFYGPISDYRILALLPSYLERSGSSLVYMAEHLINKSNDDDSGFYLNDHQALNEMLLKPTKKKTLLIGVSFGLLDFVEEHSLKLENTVVMETGGMKGRRKELVRSELHEILKSGFGVEEIHSEYGMTELLSQAYSTNNGNFTCPPWMTIKIRETNDPFSYSPANKTGGINIVDLANLYSCSFIATSDLGKLNTDGSFQILGRFDYSDIRGCNLMVAS